MMSGNQAVTREAPAGLSVAEAACRFAGVAMLAYALFLALPLPHVNDEFVYIAMASALTEHGSLAFVNGYEEYGSPTLGTFHFIPVDGRLLPQYPSSWAFLAAPFYALGGIRGLFLLNALATVLTLWLIRATGRALFDDDRLGRAAALLYAFATFAFFYAGSVWPHAVSIACIVGGMAAAALAWRHDDLRWAFAAGLVVGLGVNLRVDVILPAAAFGAWFLAASRRPYGALLALIAGLVPGLLIAAGLNLVKFGTFTPLSYGRDAGGGAASVGGYSELFPFLAAGALAVLALGLAPVRRLAGTPRAMVTAALAAVALVALLPELREPAGRVLAGAAGLLVSINFLGDVPDIQTMPDGSTSHLGLPKKALLQSLPYAAATIILLPRLLRGPDRPGIWLCLLVALCILLPFAYKSWVGGLGNHMRYLLHLVPAVVFLAAVALRTLEEEGQGSWARGVILGLALVAGGIVLGRVRGAMPLHALQNTSASALLAGIALLSIAVLVLRGAARGTACSWLRGAALVGVVVAGLSAWGLDMAVHRSIQHAYHPLFLKLRELPRDALVITTNPKWTFERLEDPRTLIAIGEGDPRYDPELLERAFAEGKAVFVQKAALAEHVVESGDAASAELLVPGEPPLQLFRLLPPG